MMILVKQMVIDHKYLYRFRIKIVSRSKENIDPIIYNHYGDMSSFNERIKAVKTVFDRKKWSIVPEIKLIIKVIDRGGNKKIDNGWEKFSAMEYR